MEVVDRLRLLMIVKRLESNEIVVVVGNKNTVQCINNVFYETHIDINNRPSSA